MRKLRLLVIISIALIFQSCSNYSSGDPQFISTQTYSFIAPVNPSTLIQNQTIYLSSDPTQTGPNTCVISTPEELTAFIQIPGLVGTEAYYQNMFNNLDAYTYLLIRGPSCPDYFEYSGYQYNPPTILIEMNHFMLNDVNCADSF